MRPFVKGQLLFRRGSVVSKCAWVDMCVGDFRRDVFRDKKFFLPDILYDPDRFDFALCA